MFQMSVSSSEDWLVFRTKPNRSKRKTQIWLKLPPIGPREELRSHQVPQVRRRPALMARKSGGRALVLLVALLLVITLISLITLIISQPASCTRVGSAARRGHEMAAAATGRQRSSWRSRRSARRQALALATRKHKRQVEVELAVSRLAVLERLDGQLRQFVLEAERRARQQQVCVLRLNFDHHQDIDTNTLIAGQQLKFNSIASGNSRRRKRERLELPACLANADFRRQVPPYMLNLYGQLMGAASSLDEAVRLMPYKSLVMRSFRQPAPTGERHGLTGADLVVELSALAPPSTPAAYELNHDHNELTQAPSEPQEWSFGDHAHPPASCQSDERLLPAGEREELCYRFHLSDQIRAKLALDGGSSSSLDSHPVHYSSPERLVEAELHLFKLPPDLSQLHEHYTTRLQQQQQNATSARHGAQSSSSSPLRTNLLEVSLFQVLEPKTADRKQAFGQSGQREFPLRLLDIRRIDLAASGWETFYVKRAVDDWIRDAKLNLGLVIKAKSMLDEPVRLGLIRFADLREVPPANRDSDFGLVHQPVLVLYSDSANANTNSNSTGDLGARNSSA